MQENPLIEKIDAILPQTQCGQCGFPGCKPYAIAIAEGRADINQCPPGNEAGIRRLADLLGVPPKPLNTAHGVPKPKAVALIDEQDCIGCTLCIQACPVDAIVGAAKLMHTVIAAECTGCERCVAPCPVDCIRMIPVEEQIDTQHATAKKQQAADRARARHQFRLQRLENERQQQAEKFAQKTITAVTAAAASAGGDPRKAAIQAALARVKAARAGSVKG